MTKQAIATFEMSSWDEKTWDGRPWQEVAGAKLTHAVVIKTYQGDLTGESTSQSLTVYRADDTASYTGLEQVTGQLDGRAGSFVLQSTGTYENGVARTTLTIVPGTGTDELAGLRGGGSFAATHEPPYQITLEYDFD